MTDDDLHDDSGKQGPIRVEVIDGEEAEVEEVPDGEADASDASAPDPAAQLEAEIEELRDRSIRTLADFENYRKRVERERREERRYAAFEPYRRILEVVDNLERALEAGGSAEDLKMGLEMIVRQIREVLRSGGVSRVPAVGQAFDPNFHDAVARFEDSEVTEPTVSEEMQSGYLMHDRLLRPAVVRVAMPAEEIEDDEPEAAEEADGPAPIH